MPTLYVCEARRSGLARAIGRGADCEFLHAAKADYSDILLGVTRIIMIGWQEPVFGSTTNYTFFLDVANRRSIPLYLVLDHGQPAILAHRFISSVRPKPGRIDEIALEIREFFGRSYPTPNRER